MYEVLVGADVTAYHGCTHADAHTAYLAAVERHSGEHTIVWLKDGTIYRAHSTPGAHGVYADPYVLLAAKMFKVSPEEVTADQRRAAKSTNHAALYVKPTDETLLRRLVATQRHRVFVGSDNCYDAPYYDGDSYDDALAEFTECVDRLGDASTVEWWVDNACVKKHTPSQAVDRGLIDEHLTDTITNALKLARAIGMNTGKLMERCARHLEVETGASQ